jgi:hypothetical protein
VGHLAGELLRLGWEFIPSDLITWLFWGGLAALFVLYLFGRFVYRPYLFHRGSIPTDEERRQLLEDALYPDPTTSLTEDGPDEVLAWLERPTED